MTTRLLDSRGRFDRAAIMRDAHRRFADGRRLGLGWTFGQCLATAWAAARIARAARIEKPPAIGSRSSSSLARKAA
ncbi:hypothetical protein AMST5_04099 [freshwater sediment metagenome]|uniref:Uncharacterized protein n=1 Tax=freshwater sediment metagenome TaxID=556182 RepID=A0AA48RFW5_9ZZZZ